MLSIEYITKTNWHTMALDKALRHKPESRGLIPDVVFGIFIALVLPVAQRPWGQHSL